MSARFIRQTRDGNHKELVDHLEGHGFEVIQTFQPLDCLVYNKVLGAGWIEIKTEKRNAAIRTSQIRFMALTRMPVAFVKTTAEALEFAKTLNGITSRQKDSLAEFLHTATKDRYHPAVIERVLSWK